MANTTVKDALSIHGRNPQFLIETTIRYRIWDSNYWKEHCFALTAETVIDRALEVNYIGGTYANQRPTEWLCLILKLLQLQPEKEIILEYLRAEEFKYLRALAMYYVRLTFPAIDVYEILEPLLDDYRKLRFRGLDGGYSILAIDEFADQLLTEERVCGQQLPRLTQRRILEQSEGLPKRKSKLAKAMGVDLLGGSDSEDDRGRRRSRSGSEDKSERFVSRSPSVESKSSRAASEDRYVNPSPEADDANRYVSRSPSPA